MSDLVGLDVGSTAVKAVRFDRRGRVLAKASVNVRVARPRPGWVERDPEAVWQAAATVLRRISRRQPGSILALGITGCGNGAVFLDRRRQPLRPGILSSDTRAAGAPRLRQAGQQCYPGQLVALLHWLRTAEPGITKRLSHALFWKDYIRLRLTGEIATDPTDAGAGGLLRFPEGDVLERNAVIPPILPSLAPAGSIHSVAYDLTGLPENLPVFVGCLDCEAAALGSAITTPGTASVVAGTWSINQVWTETPPTHGNPFLVNPSAIAGRWLVIEGSPTSATNFDWAVRTFGLKEEFNRAANLARRAPSGGAIFLPHLAMGSGAFFGLSASHDRGALLRSVMEGIVFGHRAHLERLADLTVPITRVVLGGGAARSRFWCQLFADGLQCAVDVPRDSEIGARGAALCAALGLGLWPDLGSAQRDFLPRTTHFLPGPDRDALEVSFSRYRLHLEASLQPTPNPISSC